MKALEDGVKFVVGTSFPRQRRAIGEIDRRWLEAVTVARAAVFCATLHPKHTQPAHAVSLSPPRNFVSQ